MRDGSTTDGSMKDYLKTLLAWLVAFAGAALIIMAPYNWKGLLMGGVGIAVFAAGMFPAMKARRLARLKQEQGQGRRQ